MRTPRWLLAVPLLLGAAPVVATEPDPADVKLLLDAGIATEGPALIAYFRTQVAAEATPEKIAALIRQLGDDDFDTRERATDALQALGPRALPELRRAVAEAADAEVRKRAQRCLDAAARQEIPERTAAAARVLAIRKPPGATAVLMEVLPFAENAEVADELVQALVAVAAPEGRVETVVAKGLADKEPARRGAAALLLGRHGDAEQKAAVRRLLADAAPAVRLRAAQGLLAGRDKAAVPVLVGLLTAEPIELAWQAENLLARAAGDQAPAASLGTTAASRAQCAAAWGDWWKKHEAKLDLAKADVDLQVSSPTALAQGTTRRMMDAWFLRGDLATVQRLTQAPFTLSGGGDRSFATREELDRFIEEVRGRTKDKTPALTYRQAVSVEQYLKDPRRRDRGGAEAKVLGQYRPAEVLVVYMDVQYDGNHERYGVYVRVACRPCIVGIGAIEVRDR